MATTLSVDEIALRLTEAVLRSGEVSLPEDLPPAVVKLHMGIYSEYVRQRNKWVPLGEMTE
jgi:hypothetical protein